MPKWLLPTLSEILALHDPTWTVQYSAAKVMTVGNGARRSLQREVSQRGRAEREWTGAIAALQMMLNHAIAAQTATSRDVPLGASHGFASQGLVLSGPLPILSQPALVSQLATWSLTANPMHTTAWLPFKLLPAVDQQAVLTDSFTTSSLPLLPDDPLATEQFCLVLTPWFSLVMVLGESLLGEPSFMFSFMPDVVQQAWEAIRPRILLMSSHQIDLLDDQVHAFPPVAPDYQTVMQFSRLMLEHLPEPTEEAETDRREDIGKRVEASNANGTGPTTAPTEPIAYCSLTEPQPTDDVELLKALAHEIRTPLTTIRTLTRSLLRRTDISPDVIKRLTMIDRECSEQIDRFGLIFRAVELETSNTRHAAMSLTRTSLAQVLEDSIPRWQKQASQRQLTLNVVLPQKMPTVVSDPTMLDQALTSLIERFTRNLPCGSHITIEVTPAGNQLKLQLQSFPQSQAEPFGDGNGTFAGHQPLLKSLGQLLMFQPETGSLSLNLAVTKNLFQALGGKLIVKQRPQQGEVMTVFLPLERNNPNIVEV